MAEENVSVEEGSSRANVYSLLGTLLARPPDAQLLALLAGIEDGDPETQILAGAWLALKAAATKAEEDAIAEEYHDLFIGVGRGELVPYGSWYLSGFMMDKPLVALRSDLATLGFERREDVHEPEDHAGALCETMSLLIASNGEIDFKSQRAFFHSHLEPWIGKFFDDLRKGESAAFYAAVGEFGGRFIEFERKYYSMLV